MSFDRQPYNKESFEEKDFSMKTAIEESKNEINRCPRCFPPWISLGPRNFWSAVEGNEVEVVLKPTTATVQCQRQVGSIMGFFNHLQNQENLTRHFSISWATQIS